MFGLRVLWQRFRQQKLASFALLLCFVIVVISLCSPLIANDKPLLIVYKDKVYLPIIYNYPETTFGGVFETQADYQDPYVMQLIYNHGWAIMPVVPYGENSLVLNANELPQAPNHQNILGVDANDYDVLARVLYGLRISLIFALSLTIFGSILGVAFGAILGYFGGLIDLLGQRFLEIWISLPQLFILMILSSMFEPSAILLFFIMLLFSWLPLVAVMRVYFFKTRTKGFVLTAKNLGVPTYKIIFRHLLPKGLILTLAQLPFMIAMNMTALTTLDFLGFGLPFGQASLGELLYQAKNHLQAPHLAIVSVFVLGFLLTLLIFVGEGMMRALEVKDGRNVT